jgi:hypothetical protein
MVVARIAVGEVGAAAENRHVTILRIAQHAFVGDIAPDQAIEIGEPDRPFSPSASGMEFVERRTSDDEMAKARIVNFVDRRHTDFPNSPVVSDST